MQHRFTSLIILQPYLEDTMSLFYLHMKSCRLRFLTEDVIRYKGKWKNKTLRSMDRNGWGVHTLLKIDRLIGQ